ncbi:hypothetical protein GCM10027180_35090 [Microbulbifer echini]
MQLSKTLVIQPWKTRSTKLKLDETTILNFRHLLEGNHLGSGLFEEINKYLSEKNMLLREGTIVYAIIICAPSHI